MAEIDPARRRKLELRARLHQKHLSEARNSAALGGNSRAILLHHHRQLHQLQKELAICDRGDI